MFYFLAKQYYCVANGTIHELACSYSLSSCVGCSYRGIPYHVTSEYCCSDNGSNYNEGGIQLLVAADSNNNCFAIAGMSADN